MVPFYKSSQLFCFLKQVWIHYHLENIFYWLFVIWVLDLMPPPINQEDFLSSGSVKISVHYFNYLTITKEQRFESGIQGTVCMQLTSLSWLLAFINRSLLNYNITLNQKRTNEDVKVFWVTIGWHIVKDENAGVASRSRLTRILSLHLNICSGIFIIFHIFIGLRKINLI